ncbi:MAG: membrane protein of unknown function [Promethearchaeota archaeon]|nr:MAG: membrane protein of unknown function [Candidatus Lokiarchaeota archaeon]
MVLLGLEEYIFIISQCAYVIINLILSGLFFGKYRKYKMVELIHFSFTFLLLGVTAIGWIISFFKILIIGTPLADPIIYLMFSPFFFSLMFFLFGVISLISMKERLIKFTKIGAIVISSVMFLIYIGAWFIDPDMVATTEGGIYTTWSILVSSLILISSVIMLFTASIFVYQCFETDNVENKIKGKLLLIGILTTALAGIAVIGVTLTSGWLNLLILIIFVYLFRIIGGIFFYIGFTLPQWVRKIALS